MESTKLEHDLVEYLDENFDLQNRIDFFRKRKLHTLEIELTDFCNLSCFYCYAETKSKGKNLSLEKAGDILRQARDYGIRQIAWLGGEPTLNPEWSDIVSYSKTLGLRNELWSNGTTLNEKNIEGIIDTCDRFVLHLDTVNPSNFNIVQGCKRDMQREHKKILQGFNRLLEKGFPRQMIRANITLTRSVLPDLEDTMKYFIQEKGIQTITLIPLFYVGRGKQVSEDEFLDNSELYEAFRKRSEVEDRPELMLLGTSEFCKYYQLTTVYITAEGNVIPYAGVNLPAGNIYQDRLRDVLENSFDALSFSNVVNDDGNNNQIEGSCGVCENSRYCFGTRPNSYFITGKLDQSDPTCWKD